MITYIKSGGWVTRARAVEGEFNLTKFVKETATPGIPEAPINNIPYARKNATWTPLPPDSLQTLASVLAAGNTANDQIELLDGNIFKSTNENNDYVSLGNGGVFGFNLLNSAGITIQLDNRAVVGDLMLSFNPTKPAGTYTIATLDDIPTSVATLEQVLTAGNECTDKIMQFYQSPAGLAEFRMNGPQGYISIAPKIVNVGDNTGKSITVNPDRIQVNNAGTSAFNFPKKVDGQVHTLALAEDIPTVYANIVYVNSVTPTTATIFDLNNPPTVNNNALKADVENLYIGTDSSTWAYNPVAFTYSTKTVVAPSSYQIEVGTSQDAQLIWNGNTIIFNTSCTVNIPNGLPTGYIFNGITLAGVTVTWNIAGPNTWLFGVPTPTTQKQIFTLTKRGSTTTFLLLGV
jgi:hypothetical protein